MKRIISIFTIFILIFANFIYPVYATDVETEDSKFSVICNNEESFSFPIIDLQTTNEAYLFLQYGEKQYYDNINIFILVYPDTLYNNSFTPVLSYDVDNFLYSLKYRYKEFETLRNTTDICSGTYEKQYNPTLYYFNNLSNSWVSNVVSFYSLTTLNDGKGLRYLLDSSEAYVIEDSTIFNQVCTIKNGQLYISEDTPGGGEDNNNGDNNDDENKQNTPGENENTNTIITTDLTGVTNKLDKIDSDLQAIISFFSILFIIILIILFFRFIGWFFPI